ncbi:hypothetical protein E1200_20905 [Actinomadura sp. GC306]|uniref:hypothetical protein n=1 Tax=Actinomadura sp. GC306 TaxID=2530367 RepID=UPI00104ACA1F|nr:hypothetical protein [Actinomadura sp. GC306]TDC64082.1 hypothetical protein E1200_20905 [Actinomadura sp. GC306]
MAPLIGRRRHQTTDETTSETPRRRFRLRGSEPAPAGDAAAGPAKTVVVERKPRRWMRSRPNPISMMIMAAGWAAAAILALGILLTWGGANPGNVLVDATLDAGRWLATPFHDVFTRQNPDEQLYINWALAGVVYYVLARALSWMTRF